MSKHRGEPEATPQEEASDCDCEGECTCECDSDCTCDSDCGSDCHCCYGCENESDCSCSSCCGGSPRETCSCDSGSCCDSDSVCDCLECQEASPEAKGTATKYREDLDAIKAFIADIAGLVRQTKLGSTVPDPVASTEGKVTKDNGGDHSAANEAATGAGSIQDGSETTAAAVVAATAVTPTFGSMETGTVEEIEMEPVTMTAMAQKSEPVSRVTVTNSAVKERVTAIQQQETAVSVDSAALEMEIAHIEEIISNSELSLRNSYSQEEASSLIGAVSDASVSPVESQYSYGASTVFGSDTYDCSTNDHTMTNALVDSMSPMSGSRLAWQSGFDVVPPEIYLDDDYDEDEPDLEAIHCRMVSLDLMSYMYLVESVLDERVRREMSAVR